MITVRRHVLALTMLAALGAGLLVGGCGASDSTTTASTAAVTNEVPTTAESVAGTTVAATQSEAALVGTWYSEIIQETIEFKADGTMLSTIEGPEGGEFSFGYRVADGIIILIENGVEVPVFSFSVAGDVLTLEDVETGQSDDYVRVR